MTYIAEFIVVYAATWCFLAWSDRQPRTWLVYRPQPVSAPPWAVAAAAVAFAVLLQGGFV